MGWCHPAFRPSLMFAPWRRCAGPFFLKKTTMSINGLMITGTNTGVGKTHVTAAIARTLHADGVRVGVYKPVCSGAETGTDGERFWPDVRQLSQSIDDRFPDEWVCSQRFAAALAPPAAARLEGRTVDAEEMRQGVQRWDGQVDFLLVEGVGGLLCPLTEEETVADFAVDLAFPLLIVSSLELGTVNHTLLTAEAARTRGLLIAAIVMNHVSPHADDELVDASIADIKRFCDVPVIGPLAHQSKSSPGWNGESSAGGIDWRSFMREKFSL